MAAETMEIADSTNAELDRQVGTPLSLSDPNDFRCP